MADERIVESVRRYLKALRTEYGIDAHAALDAAGTGTTGSRMANGTYATHVQLESKLREFYDAEHAMVFSTGYLAGRSVQANAAG